ETWPSTFIRHAGRDPASRFYRRARIAGPRIKSGVTKKMEDRSGVDAGLEVAVDEAAVDRDRVADDIVARLRREEDRGAGHVPGRADALHRDALRDRVATVARRRVHVRLEGARRDRGDDDMILHQPRREALSQIEDRRFRRVVAVGFPRVEAHAV